MVTPIGTVPKGTFKGANFMTPSIRGYYKLRKGYAELSEGTGFNHQPIFGVTVAPDPGQLRSKMCHSYNEAIEYIASMSNAFLFGFVLVYFL